MPAQDWDVPQDFSTVNNSLRATPRKVVAHVQLHEICHWAHNKGQERTTNKAEVIETARSSFAQLRTAATAVPLTRKVDMFGREATVQRALLTVTMHQHEHLGQTITYARSVGVTPPWTASEQASERAHSIGDSPMTQAERQRVTRYLAETGAELLHRTRHLSPLQLDYRPAAHRWSVAEIVEHIIIVEGLILRGIDVALQRPSDSASAWQGRDDALILELRNRAHSLQGPEIVLPKPEWEHADLFRRFEVVRQRTQAFAATTTANLRSHCSPHPVYGQIDCYQWLLVIGAHCERHLAQCEEVMAAPRFPRTGNI